jgi:biotin carboxylase
LTQDGPAVIEINPRLAGGMIPEIVRQATGVDLVRQQVRSAAGMPVELTPSSVVHAGIRFLLAPKAGVLRDVVGVSDALAIDGVERVSVTANSGQRVRPARNAHDRLGYVIACRPSAEEVRSVLDRAHKKLRIEVVDQPDTKANSRNDRTAQ